MTCIYVTVSVIFITSCKFNSIFIVRQNIFESIGKKRKVIIKIKANYKDFVKYCTNQNRFYLVEAFLTD